MNVLWYIDGHHDKLKDFSKHHSAVAGLPEAFEVFSNYSDVVRKKKSTCLDKGSLSVHGYLLFDTLSEPWIDCPEWKNVRDFVFSLATLVTEYCRHLAKQNEAQRSRHESDTPVRSHKCDSDAIEIECTIGPANETYRQLHQLITSASEYEIIKFTPEAVCFHHAI